MGLKAYVACRMTGRDRKEQVARARYVCAVLRQYGITPISPVLEEKVVEAPGPLVNDDKERLGGFWSRDKYIIRRIAHVVLIDGANEKSFGVEREYMLNRGVLWKPTVLLMPKIGLTVVDFEDDYVTDSVHEAGRYIREQWGTWPKRALWRTKMLLRSMPKRCLDEIYSWR
jgi:hypothetical protein